MATMAELPYELLYHIILLLVQSPAGASDFASIVSVCRKFRLFAEDEHILKLVNFDIKIEFKKFYRYQHFNSLLVKCSEAGNLAARFFLGKVVLVSSSQMFLSDWQKVECDVHPCDFVTLSELHCILATNVPAQNHKVAAFMTYFLPKQVSTGECSQTRLVHSQLVKVFLLNGSPHDFIEMVVFLKIYIKCFTGVSTEDSPILRSIRLLVSRAHRLRAIEQLAQSKESFVNTYRGLRDFSENPTKFRKKFSPDKIANEEIFLLILHTLKCDTVGVGWREAINDMDFLEELWRDDMSYLLDEAYRKFYETRAETLDIFEDYLYRLNMLCKNYKF